MIGSNAAWAAGYTGAGSRIAVIDTGTDTDHQSFSAAGFDYSCKSRPNRQGKPWRITICWIRRRLPVC